MAEAAGLASQDDSDRDIEFTSPSSSEDFDDEDDGDDEPQDMDRMDFAKTARELHEEGRRSSYRENSPAARKHMVAVDAIQDKHAAGGSM